jgi:drug/metabolite transporter (DMT)-like permease
VWAGLLLCSLGAAAGETSGFHFDDVGSDGVIAFVLLTTVATVPPFVSYVWLLGHVSPSKVAATTYVNPLVAVLLGWLIAGEAVGLATVVGGAMIVISVALVSTRDN